MKYLILLMFMLTSCAKVVFTTPHEVPINLVPISSATIQVSTYGDIAAHSVKGKLLELLLPRAVAVTQASGITSVSYSNPGANSFVLNTSGFMAGGFPSVIGTELNLGTITLSSLDDNSLRVCTGVGAPSNKCNRLYIRVFTLGSNISGSITGMQGFINVDENYGLDVLAGNVLSPVGFNSNANAASVVGAADVFVYTIPNSTNRVRLSNVGPISFPVKVLLDNAGSGNYEMKLVVQYALGYVP
jgi:hypothetical protein